MEQRIIKELADWDTLANHVLLSLKNKPTNSSGATVLVLSGDLGAGKTTFTQALAARLGVLDVVQSPTFTIMKFYNTTDTDFKQLIHMDAYRIENISELKPLRFAELLKRPETLICIEWGERIAEVLPKEKISLTINHQSSDMRLVTIERVINP